MSASKKTSDILKPSILILEDDIVISKRISNSFEKNGFKAFVKNNIEDFRKSISDKNFDAFMMDLNISIESDSFEMSGLDILNYVKKKMKDIPFIAYTSHSLTNHNDSENFPVLDKDYVNNNDNIINVDFIRRIRDTIVEKQKIGYAKEKSPSDEPPHSPIVQLNQIDTKLFSALVQSPELLQSMDWRLFEKLLANILETFQYEVELMRGTKDGGIDIIAIAKHEDWGEQKYLLQAKRWKNRVGIEPVQQLLFLHGSERATKSCLATTSTFTRGAWQLGNQYQWQLELRDYDGIQEWISRAYKIKSGL